MALRSRKALWEALVALKASLPGIKVAAKFEDMSNEIYGRLAHVYVDVGDLQTRVALESALGGLGFKVCREYGRGPGRQPLNVVDVRVAWFKGDRWDE